jgi:hypothetical protein
MSELKTSLSPTSQSFIDINDTIRKGIDDNIFKTDEDIMSFINDNGYEVEDYIQANKEYKKLIAEGKDPKDVSIPEALGKVVVKGAVDLGSELVSKGASITPKFITDAVEKISDKAGDVIPESVKDYTQGFTDPYYGTGKSQLIGEIGEDVTQGALAILGFRKALGKPKEALKDVKKAAKSVDNIIKKAPRLFTKDATKKVGKDILKDSVALTLAFSPEEATLDGLSKAFPETFKPAKPFFDMLAVDPDDPKALQYLNTFGQELITAGAIDIPLAALIGIFKSGAKVFSKQKAIDDGVTAPVASKKADGEDTLANNAKNEQVNSNTVVEDVDGNYIQEVNLTKPIEEGGEQTVKKEVYDVPTKKFSFKKFKEYMFSNRGLTDDAYDLFIARKGEPNYFKKQAIFNVKNFNKAIKEEYNVNSFDELSPEMSQKINRTLVLDDDIDEFVNLKQQNIQKVKPQAKKQIEAENATRVSEGKKPFNKKIINKKIKQLSEELGDNLTRSFFRNQQQKLLSSFKPKTREAIKNIRKNVDDNSNYLANSGVLGQKLSIKFGKNNKFYLQRSYKVFNDPDINKKLDEAIGIVEALQTGKTVKQKTLKKYADDISRVENFQQFLANATGITNPTELAPIARQYIKSFGDDSKTIFNLISDTPTYKTGTKGIRQRVLQSEELKKFRMEEVNPMTRYLRTMENLGEIVAQTKFLKSLKEDGLAKGYLVEGTKIKIPSKIKKQGVGEVTVPGKVRDNITDIGDEFAEEIDEALEMTAYKNVDSTLKHLGPSSKDVEQIGGLQMPKGTRSPLEGVFADDAFANGLTNGLAMSRPAEGALGVWSAMVSGFKGFTEYLKAVISPVTQIINNIGNGSFAIANAVLNPKYLITDLKNITKNSFAFGQNADYLKWLDKHKKLGLINTGVRAGQLKDYLKQTSSVLNSKLGARKIIQTVLYPVRKIGDIYELSDGLWRLGVYNGLRKRASRNLQPHLKEMPIANNKSLDDVMDEFVAQRVRQRMPNWYMVSKGIRQYARNIPLGSFISWNTEILRTIKNQLKGIVRDGFGQSVNDIARVAGFKDADDMLLKTGYNLKKNKSVKSLRNEGLKSLGGVTALAVGVDALTNTSANSNNINQNQVEALNSISDFYTASGKIFIEPVKFRRRKTEKGLSTEELIYTYKEPSRLDIWQSVKGPIRRVYRALKENEQMSDAEFNSAIGIAFYEILEPYVSPSILLEGIINVATPLEKAIFPEGSGQREVQNLMEKIFGRNAVFSAGFTNDLINYSNAKESEKRQAQLNTVVNEWEYDGTQWINKGKVKTTGKRGDISLPSKFEPFSILRDGLTKDNMLALVGLKTKEFNVNGSIKFKIAPLYKAKQEARNEFYKTVLKYQDKVYDEDRFFNDFESAIEKSYQADRKLFNLIKKYKVLGLTETQIAEAINANIEKGDIPKISGDKITRLLVGSYDASQWLLNEKGNEKLKTAILRLPEASLGDGSPFDKKVNETWFKYKDKKF